MCLAKFCKNYCSGFETARYFEQGKRKNGETRTVNSTYPLEDAGEYSDEPFSVDMSP